MAKSDKQVWISSGKFTLLERVAMLVFGVFTFHFLVSILNKEDYGTWMLFISIHAFIDTARSGFFKNPLIRFLNQKEVLRQESLQTSSLLLNLGFSIIFSLILLLAAIPIANSWNAPGLVPLIYVNVVLNVVLSFFTHYEYIQAARFRFKGTMIGNLIRSGLMCAAVFVYYIQDVQLDLWTLAWYFTAAAFAGAAYMFFSSRDLILFSWRTDKSWIKQLFNYGKYTLGTNLSAVVMRNIDTWMLGWYISPAAVAIYAVAIRIANLFEVPTMALAQVMFPQAVQKAESEGPAALKSLYENSVATLQVMLIPLVIVVIVFSDWIVELIAGPEYAEAGFILNITMLYGLIIPFNKQMGILLDAVGKAKTNMLFVARNAIINVVLNALLIPIWGIPGAAWASLFTMLLVMGINQRYLNKNFDVTLAAVFGNMLKVSKELPARAKAILNR
ncbi:oligosaccharide flippase family protein [Luteibaculum oceani]|uniref:Oligosaccharide flippase family protein n=1 Tax=Luteibaculum oceani TaxID=1294296 RepID=A0A5C6V166_9FLAO|nr:oligosaccharide flippase family protein [Luteibaculum oceani]TXC78640.1 oligosaccharide flippase family protein [Luteibaculum oceani]